MGLVGRFRRKLSHLTHRVVGSAKVSYAQCGEDIIVDYILSGLGIEKVNYLDIGAHDPIYLSNTYYFYKQGGHGVCIEPDPSLGEAFQTARPRDIYLPIGIGATRGTGEFFVMTTPTLNTFSRVEAERYQSYGTERIERIISVEVRTINEVIEEYCRKTPHFVSIDVEGLDLAILKTLNFSTHRPRVICVETQTYTEDGSERKLVELIDMLKANDYFIYADTYINTIAVDRRIWNGRLLPSVNAKRD